MSSHRTKYFHKKEKESVPSTLDYLNKRRQEPTDSHPIGGPCVDPFSTDLIDEDVNQADVLNRRERDVPVGGQRFPRNGW